MKVSLTNFVCYKVHFMQVR